MCSYLCTVCLSLFTPVVYVPPGGYLSNSLAIMTDALHILADLVGILFSLLALWLSTKPPTKNFTFGLHRLGQKPDFFPFLQARCVLCEAAPSADKSRSKQKVECSAAFVSDHIPDRMLKIPATVLNLDL